MILVIKLGGKILEGVEARLSMSRQIAELARQDHQVLIVHGGGKQLTEMSQRLGLSTIRHEGRRVTDEATLEVAKMVFSSVNRELVASLIASGAAAIGISSFDANLVRCRKRPPIPLTLKESSREGKVQLIDFGLIAEIESIDTTVLRQLWELQWIPVMSCLCSDPQGQILNINADTLAAELAIALPATRLISVSDVEGIYLDSRDPSNVISELSIEQAQRYLREGILSDGMVPKVETALKVLRQGVEAVQILSGLRQNALLDGLAGETGTLFSRGF